MQRALCEAYGIVINVITSDQQHWFMRYEPEAQPKKAAEVFITYIAPIHYNAVRCAIKSVIFSPVSFLPV